MSSRISSGDWSGDDSGAMSSKTAGSSGSSSGAGKRPCDNCKKNKIRCGGSQAPSNKCLNCSVHLLECTYESEDPKKRRRPKGYIEELQDRIKELEGALHKVCPDEILLKEIYARLDEEPQNKSTSGPSTPLPGPSRRIEPADILRRICRIVIGPEDDPFRDDASESVLMQRLQKIREEGGRFYGDAGTSTFIRAAMTTKEGATGRDARRDLLRSRRPYFWVRSPWELKVGKLPEANYTFPPQDLMDELVDAYFEHANLFLPLLHRPSFERSLADGLHLCNDSFGGVVLLVCAVGSRFIRTYDERILLDGVESPYSAGWRWFMQVDVVKIKMLSLPDLYDIQMYALAASFLQGTFEPHATWTLAGIGIRVAQDMGIHQRRVPLDQLTIEHEMCKRAFWVLVSIDQMASTSSGRSCAITNDDMDLDMPIECDDEYWENEDPKKRFRQPEGKPSYITVFNHQLRLNKIMAFTLNSVYHVKSKMWEFILDDWQVHIVEELDSALNRWLAAVPECVRWDPFRKDEKFYKLSFMLMCWYYYVQILVHRLFIPTRDKTSSHPFPSLAICTNAARACSNLVDAYRKRGYSIHGPMTLFAFTSGIILSLNRWGNKRSQASASDTRGVDEIYKCLDVLKVAEERWHNAGRAWDILHGLVRAQEGPRFEEISQASSSSSTAEPLEVHASRSLVQPRRTVQLRSPSNVSTPSDYSSPRTLPQSYHVGSASTSGSSTGSTSSPYALPLLQTPTPEYYTPPESQGTPDSNSAPLYPSQPSNTSFDNNDLQLSYSYPGSGSVNATTAQGQPSIMDRDTMNMWMSAPTGIGFDDWENFLGGFNWEEANR